MDDIRQRLTKCASSHLGPHSSRAVSNADWRSKFPLIDNLPDIDICWAIIYPLLLENNDRANKLTSEVVTYICSSINQSSFSYVKYPKLTSVRDLPSLLKSLLNETFPFSGLQQQPSYQILSLAAFQDLVLWRMNKYAASILPLEEDSDILNIDKLFEDNMNLLDRFSDEEVSILQDYDANLSIYDISNKYHQSEAGVVRVIHRLVGQINDAV